MTNLPTNHSSEWMPSLEVRAARLDHREWIGGRVMTLLNHYWREDDPAEMTAAIGSDWGDVLEGLPENVIQKACIQYQRDEPRRKPTPGAIYQLALSMMPRPKAVPRPALVEPTKEPRVTAERANELIREAGIKLNTFGGK